MTVPNGTPTGPIRVSHRRRHQCGLRLELDQHGRQRGQRHAGRWRKASAHPGQTITLKAAGWTPAPTWSSRSPTPRATADDLIVRPARVDAGGTQAQVRVPLNAVTGAVRVVGDNGIEVALQILPAITDVQVESVAGDGTSAQVLIAGLGFVEGGNSEYRFGRRWCSMQARPPARMCPAATIRCWASSSNGQVR